MKTSKIEKAENRKNAIEYLRTILTPGTTVYTLCLSVSSSGMSRKISCYVVNNGRIQNISGYVGNAIDYNRDYKTGALKVSGCGMDMGFHVVYSLGRALYPEGFKLSENQYGRNGDKSGYDKDGGYSLNQSWL